jgi:hypothetical protein
VTYPIPQTRAGSLRIVVEEGAPQVFEGVTFAVAGISRDVNGRAMVTESMTVDATVSISNESLNEALRANVLWSVYEGNTPASGRLIESWTEEVRLLPGRDREYQFQFGVSDTTSSVYTLMATLVDQVRGQVWSAQELIYSGDILDNPTPYIAAAYYTPAGELQVCYGLVTNQNLLPLEAEDRAVTVEWTDGLGAVVAVQEWSLYQPSFTMSVPVALPVTIQSSLSERNGELTRTLVQDTFLVGCDVGGVCDEVVSAQLPTLFSMEDGPTSLHYLLIALAAIAIGVLLWLMITRHERERKAYEAAQVNLRKR